MRIVEQMRTKDWIPLLLIPAVLFLQSVALGQSDDAPFGEDEHERPRTGFVNPFSKIFSRKPAAPQEEQEQEQERPTPPRVPATETATRGGLLVPLKSFTNRVFNRTENVDDTPEPHVFRDEPSASRPFREPFKNVPRPRIINPRDRGEESSIQLEEYATPEPSPGRISTRFPADEEAFQAPAPRVPVISKSLGGSRPINSNVEAGSLESPTSLGNHSTSRRVSDGNAPVSPAVKPRLEPATKTEGPSLIDLSSEKPIDTGSQFRNISTPNQITTPRVADEPVPDSANTVPLPIPAPKAPNADASPSVAAPSAPRILQGGSSRPPASIPAPELPAGRLTSGEGDTLGTMQLPGVRVSIQGPDSLLVGQESNFEVIARNDGSIDLNGLILRLAVPANVTIGSITATDGGAEAEESDGEKGIVWELPALPARSHKSLRISLKTDKPEHFALGIEWTAIPQSQEYSIRVQQPQLELALEGPSEAVFGSPLNYRLRVRNSGNAVAKNVELELNAASFGNSKSNIGDIAPSDEKVIDVELLFEQSGMIPITAAARSELSNIHAASAIDVRVKQSALEASWTGPAEFYQGSAAEYNVVLTNKGDATATDVACSLTLPAGAVPATLPPGAKENGTKVEWKVGALAPHETLTIPVQLTFDQVGANTVTFHAECSSGLEARSQVTTQVDSVVDLQLTVNDPAAPAPVGRDVFYDLEIFNRGKKVANGVDVLVQFSEGIEPMRCEGAEARIVPGQVIFNTIPTIAPGEKVKLRVVAEASQGGVHRFRVEVKSGNREADLLQEASTRYLGGK